MVGGGNHYCAGNYHWRYKRTVCNTVHRRESVVHEYLYNGKNVICLWLILLGPNEIYTQ